MRAEKNHYALTSPLSEIRIPASLHESLMARLDRLPTVRELAQMGAVLGREFAYEMLRAIAAIDEPRLRDGLGRLVEAELLYQRGRPPHSRYVFKHALIQDAAYQSLLRRTRQHYHRQVAELLENSFTDTVETSPELVAHHYTEAGMPAQAVTYWQRAGERAVRRSANEEVIGHLTAGLVQLTQLPETPELAKQELAVQRLLGQASFAARGYASAEATRAFSRARGLCAVIGEDDSIYPVLLGVWLFEYGAAHHADAATTAKELLALAERSENAGAHVAGHLLVAISSMHLGDLPRARRHFEASVQRYRGLDAVSAMRVASEFGLELGVPTYGFAAWCLQLLGCPEQALQLGNEALSTAERVPHDYTRSRGLYYNRTFHTLRREWRIVETRAAAGIASAQERGHAIVAAVIRIMQGSAKAMLAPREEFVAEVREAIAGYRATGARTQGSYHLALLAQALAVRGRHGEGLVVLHEAAAFAAETGERFVEAEIHRLRGNLLLAQSGDGSAEAEACYLKALEVARAGGPARRPRSRSPLDRARRALAQRNFWRRSTTSSLRGSI